MRGLARVCASYAIRRSRFARELKRVSHQGVAAVLLRISTCLFNFSVDNGAFVFGFMPRFFDKRTERA